MRIAPIQIKLYRNNDIKIGCNKSKTSRDEIPKPVILRNYHNHDWKQQQTTCNIE